MNYVMRTHGATSQTKELKQDTQRITHSHMPLNNHSTWPSIHTGLASQRNLSPNEVYSFPPYRGSLPSSSPFT